MLRTPAGITSSVTAGDKKFILQTEFLLADKSIPSGKIVTTVAVSGQVVHRMEKMYDQSWESEEHFIIAEKAVKTQHLAVARSVKKKSFEFIESALSIDITPEDQLRVLPGIADVWKVDLSDESEESSDQETVHPFIKNMKNVRDLAIMISQNTRAGRLKRVIGSADNSRFMLTGYSGGTFFIKLKDDSDVAKVISELENKRAR